MTYIAVAVQEGFIVQNEIESLPKKLIYILLAR